jgi:signal-transduction protein with cAMP-binding, CBS, and nucleotidyltransferase domain
MATLIREVMTPNPRTLEASATVEDAARAMKDDDIGDVIVVENDRMCGIVTDRDIAVRVVAEGKSPSSVRLSDICSADVTAVSPDGPIDEAVRLMRERAVRRVPVVQDGRPVGIVSMGDLAQNRDPQSALSDVSAAPPNR